jgi:hypothetical protein
MLIARTCHTAKEETINANFHEFLSSNSSAEGTSSIADISQPISLSFNEAGSPPPASSFKEENPDEKEA